MAAPLASSVILPLDTGNTGKQIQTQSELIGGQTVHAHYFIPRSNRRILGRYYFNHALQSVQASAYNGSTTAYWWLENPGTGSVRARLRKFEIAITDIGEADMLTAPRLQLSIGAYTGTATGTPLAVAKHRATDNANVANMRTTSAGWTPTVGNPVWGTVVPPLRLTTSGLIQYTQVVTFDPWDEDDFIDLGSGEYAALWQPDAGTASDTRRFSVWGEWDEYDNA